MGGDFGTIIERPRKDGTRSYHAQLAVQRSGGVHRETKTFDRRPAGVPWLRKRERKLDEPGALEAVRSPDPTLGQAIDRYMAASRRTLGRTKIQVLRSLKGYDLAEKPCSQVTSAVIVALARELAAGRQAQTAGNHRRTSLPSSRSPDQPGATRSIPPRQ